MKTYQPKHMNMFVTVEGHNCEGKAFTVKLEFILHPPKDSNHYGTGYYMSVITPSFDYYVDVRYAQTLDIEKLADAWIRDNYGKNAEKLTKSFPPEEFKPEEE